MTYDEIKIKLLFLVLNGCKYAEWHFFNIYCERELTKKEFSSLKRNSEYKRLFNHFGRV